MKLGFLMVRPVPKLGSSMNSMTHSSLLLGLVVVVHLESGGGLVDVVPVGGLLLEGHPELGSGAGESGEVDLDSVSDLLVLLEQVVDELLGIGGDGYHFNRPLFDDLLFKLI